MDQHAVVADGQPGRGRLHPLGIEAWGAEVDVVGLPLQRRGAHVDARAGDLVDAAALVVEPLEGIAVQHLDLVATLEVDAAVAARLAPGLGHEGRAELDVHAEIGVEVLGDQ